MRIKNWDQFQHFKDRNPPWIRLYKTLLDDPDWHNLDGDSAKMLVQLWLIASEDKEKQGKLPQITKLAFRLRVTEKDLNKYVIKLSHWLIHDDINTISEGYHSVSDENISVSARYHVDAPETETETETDIVECSVIDYLNTVTGNNYRKVRVNLDLITARLKEGYSAADMMAVVDMKASEWLKDDKMRKYLRPTTLFNREKFSQYAGLIWNKKEEKFDMANWMKEMTA